VEWGRFRQNKHLLHVLVKCCFTFTDQQKIFRDKRKWYKANAIILKNNNIKILGIKSLWYPFKKAMGIIKQQKMLFHSRLNTLSLLLTICNYLFFVTNSVEILWNL